MKPIPREVVIHANGGPSKYELYLVAFFVATFAFHTLYYSYALFLSSQKNVGEVLPVAVSVGMAVLCCIKLRKLIHKRKEIVETVQDKLILQDIYDGIADKKPQQVRVSEK